MLLNYLLGMYSVLSTLYDIGYQASRQSPYPHHSVHSNVLIVMYYMDMDILISSILSVAEIGLRYETMISSKMFLFAIMISQLGAVWTLHRHMWRDHCQDMALPKRSRLPKIG